MKTRKPRMYAWGRVLGLPHPPNLILERGHLRLQVLFLISSSLSSLGSFLGLNSLWTQAGPGESARETEGPWPGMLLHVFLKIRYWGFLHPDLTQRAHGGTPPSLPPRTAGWWCVGSGLPPVKRLAVVKGDSVLPPRSLPVLKPWPFCLWGSFCPGLPSFIPRLPRTTLRDCSQLSGGPSWWIQTSERTPGTLTPASGNRPAGVAAHRAQPPSGRLAAASRRAGIRALCRQNARTAGGQLLGPLWMVGIFSQGLELRRHIGMISWWLAEWMNEWKDERLSFTILWE